MSDLLIGIGLTAVGVLGFWLPYAHHHLVRPLLKIPGTAEAFAVMTVCSLALGLIHLGFAVAGVLRFG